MAKVLVVGNGGREHAICYKFKQSKAVDEVFVARGNPNMRDVATIVDIDPLDFTRLINFVKAKAIDLTFVGPEIPLCAGIVDAFEKAGLKIFGPSKAAAELEGSKVFSKYMMHKYHIPTAKYQAFDDYTKALTYLKTQQYPIVIKCDGLAAGKGVVICPNYEDAKANLQAMMLDKRFQKAGSSVVIEEYLEGEEFSLLSFVNGDKVYPMEIAQDHKRAFDNDQGLNTGGMGAYTPVSHISKAIQTKAINEIVKPMAKAMVAENKPFVGILYAGCMVCQNEVKTIEYNVRFGDPETEVLLLSLESDLYEVINAVLAKQAFDLVWSKQVCLGVVLASKGYPEAYQKNHVIYNLDAVNATVFHMGTSLNDQNEVITTGGRVLFVAAKAESIAACQTKVYQEIAKITCDNLFYRHDIGNRAL